MSRIITQSELQGRSLTQLQALCGKTPVVNPGRTTICQWAVYRVAGGEANPALLDLADHPRKLFDNAQCFRSLVGAAPGRPGVEGAGFGPRL